MHLVIIKLVEVVSRALFTVGVTYMLAVQQAGQFGLANTLIGLFAFAFGWERHIDIQRRLAGKDAQTFDRAVRGLPRFWAANWVTMTPLLLVFTYGLAGLTWTLCAVVAVIAICEQIGNAIYNLCVIEVRYQGLVAIVACKSLFLAVTIAALFLFAREWLTLEVVLWCWAGAGLLSLAIIAMGWARVMHPEAHPGVEAQVPADIRSGIFDQHKASFTHFFIGALAVFIIQIDRLVVGMMLPLPEVSIYFRQVVLVSLAYQFFNVVSYSRTLPKVFKLSRESHFQHAHAVIKREYLLVAGVIALGFAGCVLIDSAAGHRFTRALMIDATLVALLLVGSLLRIHADFSALILNAQFYEKQVLTNQIASFVIGFCALVGLTWAYGLYGTAFGTVAGSFAYLALNTYSIRKLSRKTEV